MKLTKLNLMKMIKEVIQEVSGTATSTGYTTVTAAQRKLNRAKIDLDAHRANEPSPKQQTQSQEYDKYGFGISWGTQPAYHHLASGQEGTQASWDSGDVVTLPKIGASTPTSSNLSDIRAKIATDAASRDRTVATRATSQLADFDSWTGWDAGRGRASTDVSLTYQQDGGRGTVSNLEKATSTGRGERTRNVDRPAWTGWNEKTDDYQTAVKDASDELTAAETSAKSRPDYKSKTKAGRDSGKGAPSPRGGLKGGGFGKGKAAGKAKSRGKGKKGKKKDESLFRILGGDLINELKYIKKHSK